MPASLDQIPRDENGAVVGRFRVRHRDPSFTDGVAGISFDHGLTGALSGYDLTRLVVAMGSDLELEPAPDEPVDPVTEPDAEPASEPILPPPAPIEEPEDDAPMPLPSDRDALLAIGAARGIPLDPKWSVKRMQQVLSSIR